MNNIWKRSLSLLLALVMTVGMLPMGVLAEELEAESASATSEAGCEHAYVPGETVAPTCTEAGYTVYTCSGTCGDSYEDDVVDALGHDWGVWEPNEDETMEQRTCAACGEVEAVNYEVMEAVEVLAVAAEDDSELEPAPLADAEGIIWMDKEKHNASGNSGYFKGKIIKGELDNMIRKVVGLAENDDSIQVTYDGMDVGDLYALAVYQDKLETLQTELTDAVSYHQLVTFAVNGTPMDIAFRNILTVNIDVPDVVIESKGEPAGLAAQVEAALAEIENGIVISHIDEISIEKAGAVVDTYNYNAAWPEVGADDVTTAEVAVTVYDSVDGAAHTVYGAVILRESRQMFNVTYISQGETLLSQDVIEGEATPACNPTRTYYTLSWDKAVAATVTENVTYTAVWTPNIDVNDNGIADQEESFTVTYADADGSVLYEKAVKWGKATPAYTPSRTYYTFTGWNKTVAATVTQDVTYTAAWAPINDSHIPGDGIADEEDEYAITYTEEDGTVLYTYKIKWGEKTTVPADPTRPGTNYRFSGWDPIVASTVSGDATYRATWTSDAIVTFKMGEESFKLPVVNKKVADPYTETDDDGVIWLGWYTDNGDKWDFTQEVASDMTLTAKWLEDADNDNKEDGTAADPYIEYVFMTEDGSVELERIRVLDGAELDWLNDDNTVDATKKYMEDTDDDGYIFLGWWDPVKSGDDVNIVYTYYAKLGVDRNNNGKQDGAAFGDPFTMYDFYVKGENVDYVDWLEGEPQVNTDDYIPVLTAPEVFAGWDVKQDTVPSGDTLYTYTAIIITDANGNGKDDSLEIDKLVLSLNGEAFAGRLSAGKVVTEYGVIEVVDGKGKSLLFEQDGEQDGEQDRQLFFSLGDDTVVKVTPAEGAYVDDIKLTGPNAYGWVLSYDEARNATFRKNADYVEAGIATIAEEESHTISVDFGVADFVYTSNINLVLDIDEVAAYGEEEIYKALIETPAYADEAVTIQYLAREEQSVNVPLANVLSLLDTAIKSTVENFLGGNTISVHLDPVWRDVDAEAVVYDKTVYAVAMEYLEGIGAVELDENGDPTSVDEDVLIANAGGLEEALTSVVNEKALISSFASIPEGKDWDVKYMDITYADERVVINDNTLTVQLKETRSDVIITPVQKELTLRYDQVNTDALLANFTVTDESGKDIKGSVDYSDLEYTKELGANTVKITTKQNEQYKAASGEFTLNITKGKAVITVPNVIVDVDTTYTLADVTPTVEPAGASLIQVIAGVDMENVQLALDSTGATAKNVEIKAWVKLDGLYNSVLETIGLGTGFHTVDEIKAAMAGTALDGKLDPALDNVEAMLDKAVAEIESRLPLDVVYTLQITFEKEAIPTNAGFYINYVTLMDADKYDAEDGIGYVLIHPLTVLPNNGIQLFLGETSNTQNVFEIIRDGENKNLGVLYDGKVVDCNVHYYGITTRGNVYMETVGPNESGIYLAASAYYDEAGEKLGTDLVVMLIAPDKANIDVARESIVYDEKAHKPTVTVTDVDGNVIESGVGITMITGSVAVDTGDANVSLEDISANLNIDFPKDLDDAWNHYVESRVDMPEEITVQTVLNFLNWCKVQIDTKIPVDTLVKLHVPENYIVKAQDAAKAVCDRLITELNKLPNVDASVTFEDNKQFTEHGIYVYYGIITDPDLLPDANPGLLIIKTEDDFYMYDTVRPYNGQEQMPDFDDTTDRDRIDMIIDRAAKRVNFKLDGDATKLIEKIESKFNVTINNNEIALSELYERSGLKAEDLANTIIDYIWEQVPERLKNRFPGAADKVEEMIEKLEAKLPGVRTKLINKLVEIDKLPDDLVLAFNMPGAIEVGTYEFHSFSYEIGYTTAMLEIAPSEITIKANDVTTTVGVEKEITYTVLINGEEATAEQIAELSITYTLKDTDGNEIALADALQTAGEYTITPVTPYSDDEHYAVIINEATLTVVDPVISNTGVSLSLEGVVYMEFMVDLAGFPKDIDFTQAGGVVVWIGDEPVTNREQLQIGAENCVTLEKSMYYSDVLNSWAVTSLGINAKEYGDEIYVRPYVELDNGTIVYAKVAHSSPQKYCNGRLNDVDSKQTVKETCAALLEYGTAAQNLFDYELDALVNAGWDFTPYSIDFSVDMIDALDKPTADKANTLSGTRTSNISTAQASLALEGAIRIELGYDIAVEDIVTAEVLVWTEADYNAAETLAYEAETYSYKVSLTWGYCSFLKKECYIAESNHIPAKEIGDTVYFNVRVVTADGEVYRGGLSYYSPDRYVEQHYNNDNAEIATVVKALAVYSEKARILFNYFD